MQKNLKAFYRAGYIGIDTIYLKLKDRIKHDANVNGKKYSLRSRHVVTFCVQAVSVLLEVCLIINVSGLRMTFTSSLQSTNRTYSCPGEIVTYVCSGNGSEMDLYAPPHVSSTFPLTYDINDTPGLKLGGSGPIVTSLTSTNPLEANLLVQNSSLPEFSVHCIVRAHSFSKKDEIRYRPSGIYIMESAL